MEFLRLPERFALSDWHFAHRGFWKHKGPPENSLAAFEAAVNAGYGIELDVRPSSDAAQMVFHDPLLDRLTQETGLFASYSAEELAQIWLADGSGIPSLAEVLEMIAGRVPVLCEIKIDGATDPTKFAQRVGDSLLAYTGPVAAMSFSPEAVAALPTELMRGQLIVAALQSGDEAFQAALEAILNVSPDYAACHVTDVKRTAELLAQTGLPIAAWTITSQATALDIKPHCDALIFEGFEPSSSPGRERQN